jgi:hypothetical protein
VWKSDGNHLKTPDRAPSADEVKVANSDEIKMDYSSAFYAFQMKSFQTLSIRFKPDVPFYKMGVMALGIGAALSIISIVTAVQNTYPGLEKDERGLEC